MLGAASTASAVLIEPDAFATGTDISNAFAGVTLTTVFTGADVNTPTSTGAVFSVTDANATTGTRAFGQSTTNSTWGNGSFEYLLIEFIDEVSSVTLDFFANDSGGDDNPQLLGFDVGGVQIGLAEVIGTIPLGSPASLTVNGAIKSVRAYWDETNRASNGGLDNLQYTAAAVPEPASLALMILGLAAFRNSQRKRI